MCDDQGREFLFTSSSLPPHGSASSSGQGEGERARRRAVRSASRWRMRFVRCRSAVSAGVRKKVSSASEGRSDQPPGEPGLETAAAISSLLGAAARAMRGSVSSRRRASYLCVCVLRERWGVFSGGTRKAAMWKEHA